MTFHLRQLLLICVAILGFTLAGEFGRPIVKWLDRVATRTLGESEGIHYIMRIGCWVEESVAFETFNLDGSTQRVTHPLSGFSEILNFINRQASTAAPKDHFALSDNFGSSVENGIFDLYEILKNKNVRSVIYLNYPSGLTAFSSFERMEPARLALESIASEYPKAKPHAERLLSLLLNSEGYQFLLRERELKKQSGADSLSPLLPQLYNERWLLAWPELRNRTVTSMRHRMATDFETLALLNEATQNYLRVPRIPMRAPPTAAQYFEHSGGNHEVWVEFWKMAAEMTAQKGIPFVYFITPLLNVSDSVYQSEYYPNFVRTLLDIERAHPNFVISNHALDHDLTVNELSSMKNTRGYEFKTGYLTNVIGQYKRARLLYKDLQRAKVVRAGGELRAQWSWEKNIPIQALPKEWLPEDFRSEALEENYQPLLRTLSQPHQLRKDRS